MGRISWAHVLALLVIAGAVALGVQASPAGALAQSARLPEPSPAAGTPAPARSAAAGGASFTRLFLEPDPTNSTSWFESHTLVDGSGGIHVTFDDASYIYYAHCSAGCGNPANWSEGRVAGAGSYNALAEPTLGLDGSGHPRLMWFANYGAGDYYYYAECSANCTGGMANWTSVAIVSAPDGYPQNPRYFALDAQYRPRMVYPMINGSNSGFYYLTCASGCTTASHWVTTAVTTPGFEPNELQLAVATSGRRAVLGYDQTSPALVYAQCDANCTTQANWHSVGPLNPGYYDTSYGYVLRLDSQARPRIAYYAADQTHNVLHYAWSDANTLSAAGWSSYTLNYPSNSDYQMLDLAFDGQDRPRVAFATDKLAMSYVTCTANCESAAPAWQQTTIESSDDLNASDHIDTNPACMSSSWSLVGFPSLALDASGSPNVSYFARHWQYCHDQSGNPKFLYDAQSVRFALAGGGSGPTPSLTPVAYLPLTRR